MNANDTHAEILILDHHITQVTLHFLDFSLAIFRFDDFQKGRHPVYVCHNSALTAMA